MIIVWIGVIAAILNCNLIMQKGRSLGQSLILYTSVNQGLSLVEHGIKEKYSRYDIFALSDHHELENNLY